MRVLVRACACACACACWVFHTHKNTKKQTQYEAQPGATRDKYVQTSEEILIPACDPSTMPGGAGAVAAAGGGWDGGSVEGTCGVEGAGLEQQSRAELQVWVVEGFGLSVCVYALLCVCVCVCVCACVDSYIHIVC